MSIEDMVKDCGTLGKTFVDHLNSYCLYQMPMAKDYAEYELMMIRKLYPQHFETAEHLYKGVISATKQ